MTLSADPFRPASVLAYLSHATADYASGFPVTCSSFPEPGSAIPNTPPSTAMDPVLRPQAPAPATDPSRRAQATN